jgi:SPP1 gp7 family putative phage head morphogenesis protein
VEFSVAELIRRAGRTRQSELVLAAIVPPVGLERDLRAVHMQIVHGWSKLYREEIAPEYAATIGEGVRDTPADVQEETDDAAATMNRLVLTLGPVLEDWVVRVEKWHRTRLGQLFTASGVRLDTLLGRGDVARTLESVLAENLALIRSLNEQMRNDISGTVFRGLTNRSTATEVAREIRKLTGVATNRAKLIASDQLQKLTSRLDQERQEQLGIREFQWAHSGKKHPRPHHKARDGVRFKWNSVVARTDPPGRAIRCGCKARAVVKL